VILTVVENRALAGFESSQSAVAVWGMAGFVLLVALVYARS